MSELVPQDRQTISSPSGRKSAFAPELTGEPQLEQAIIDNLQAFLLELGKGFAFVARQKHLRFEDRFKTPGDNPTVGLILCSEKNEAVAKYSVLSENQQLFASKYLAYFPSEEELALELKKERHLIEARRESTHD